MNSLWLMVSLSNWSVECLSGEGGKVIAPMSLDVKYVKLVMSSLFLPVPLQRGNFLKQKRHAMLKRALSPRP